MQAQKVADKDVDEQNHSKSPQRQKSEHHDDHHDDHDHHLQEYSPQKLRQIKIRGVISVIGGMLLHVVLGTFYVWGTISPYIAAYMKQYDPSVTVSLMAIVFPFLGLITDSVLSFGVKLAEKIGFKIMVFMCGTSISIAFLADSFITNIYGFIVIYCVMIGIATGLVYMLPVLCGWKYFPNNRGVISGLTIAGYGFGSFIFNFVCQSIANPSNKHPDIPVQENGVTVKYFGPDVYDQVPKMLQILSGCSFVLTVLATLMINYPRDLHLEYQAVVNKADDIKNHVAYHPPHPHTECDTVKQGLYSKPFAIFVPMILTGCLLGMLMANCYKIYGLAIGMDDYYLTIVGSASSVCNGASRAIWAAVMDKTSFKFCYCLNMVIQMAMSLALAYNQNHLGYIFIISLTMGCEGGMLSMYPAACSKIFGGKQGPIIYGFLFFQIGVSTMLGYILYSFGVPSIGYVGVFWVCFGMQILGIFLGVFLPEDYEWKKQ